MEDLNMSVQRMYDDEARVRRVREIEEGTNPSVMTQYRASGALATVRVGECFRYEFTCWGAAMFNRHAGCAAVMCSPFPSVYQTRIVPRLMKDHAQQGARVTTTTG